jgi:ERCC4-type nuclease
VSIPLLVDDREPAYIASRLTQYGYNVAVGRLHSADVQFFPHGLSVGIERSTISDLLGKMSDRRIVTQAHRLIEDYDLGILLREGSFRRGRSQHLEYHDSRHPLADKDGWVTTGWAWTSWQGMQFDLWLLGLIVWDCPTLGEAASDIAVIVESLSKDEHRWIKERTRPDIKTADAQYRNNVWALSAFNGIGPEVAQSLLRGRSFADVVALAANDPKALTSLKGFGPKRASSLHEEVSRKYG